jgi:S-DNA-T family DNA segregation ATPase FtsK/SpoIIIE
MLLLLDSWEGFVQVYEPVHHGRCVDVAVQLLREGPSAGLTAVLTGDRSLLTSRAAALVRDRLILRSADPADYALAGLPLRGLPRVTLPGRALLAADAGVVEVQLAVLGADPSGVTQAAELARLVTGWEHDRATGAPMPHAAAPAGDSNGGGDGNGDRDRDRDRDDDSASDRAGDGASDSPSDSDSSGSARDGTAADRQPPISLRPLRIRTLPPRVCLADLHLDRPADRPRAPLWTPVGVGGDDAEPVGVDLAGGGLLVAGPPGSGRSTALAAIAAWHRAHGTEVAIVAPPRSPLARSETGTVLGPADGEALGRFLAVPGGAPRVVLVDDAELLLDTAADVLLTAHLTGAADPGTAIVAAGGTGELLAAFRGLTIPLRRARRGVLLCPSGPLDGDLLGVRLRRGSASRPGRGVLVHGGQTTTVQVAQP